MMKHLHFVLIVAIAGLSSCEKANVSDGITVDAELATTLRSNSETMSFGDNNLVLETYVWRDFMPVSPPNGSKMIAVGKLVDVNEVGIPQTIVLKKQYIINGDKIWMSGYGEIKNEPNHVLEGVTRNGPQWETGIEVDVVCEFQHQGRTYRVLAKSQLVHATY